MKSNLNLWLNKMVSISFVGPTANTMQGRLHQIDDVGIYIFHSEKNVFIPFTSILHMTQLA